MDTDLRSPKPVILIGKTNCLCARVIAVLLGKSAAGMTGTVKY